MGKYIGPSVRSKIRSATGEVDWSKLKDMVAKRGDLASAVDKTIRDNAVVQDTLASPTAGIDDVLATPQQDNAAMEARLAADRAALAGIGEVAGIRGDTEASTRQDIQDDPQQYETFQEIYDAPVGAGVGLGTGVGYRADSNVTAAEVSPVNLINKLQERLIQNPNDEQAKAQLLQLAPEKVSVGALEQYREGITEPGQKRPGVQDSTLTDTQKLEHVRNSYDMGRKVQKSMDRMTFNMSTAEVQKTSAKVIKAQEAKKANKEARSQGLEATLDEQIHPGTLNEVINLGLSTYADVKESGGKAQPAMADLFLHAVLNEKFNTRMREARAEDKKDFAGWEGKDADDFIAKGKQSTQSSIGRTIEKGMAVTGSKAQTNALGAWATNMVQEAFPELFNPAGDLLDSAFDTVMDLQDMSNIILPNAKVSVRTAPKLTPEGKPKKSKIKGPRRSDVNKDHGDQEFNNNTIDTLEANPYSINQDMRSVVEQLVGVIDGNGETAIDPLLKISSVENIDGDKVKGTLNNRDESSRKFVLKNGERIVDKDDPTGFKTKNYLGNKVKDFKFNETMDWASKYTGAIFYDYFTAPNGRFFVKQTEGNFQSDKLARAMLDAAESDMYDLNSPSDLKELKAGIMMKFGFDKLDARARAAKFDEVAPGWMTMLDSNLQVIDGQAMVDAVDPREGHEGWAGVSAIVEGVKLLTAINNPGQMQYKSGFYTEIDGVANGLGHNAMQAGDTEVARRANLLGKNEEDDVYRYNGKQFQSIVASAGGENAAAVKSVLDFFGIGKVGFDQELRDFSKKPVMIFGYGAGDGVIMDQAKLWIAEKLQSLDSSEYDLYHELVGDNQEAIMDTIAYAMKDSVHSSFKDVKKLSSIMTELTTLAVEQGIDPELITFGGHSILFGYKSSERIAGLGFDDRGVEVKPTQTKLDPQARIVKPDASKGEKFYDRKARPGETTERLIKKGPNKGKTFEVLAGQLKAATQAAVLPTHNNDGINIGKTFNEIAAKHGIHVGAQIFDGVLVTPKKAAAMAKQLNQDFYDINISRSTLMRMKDALDTNPVRRFNWNKNSKTQKMRRAIDVMNKNREKLLRRLRAAGIKQFWWD